MYAYYHEHFELSKYDSLIRVTCICSKDFVWSVAPSSEEYHRCPHCSELWVFGRVGGYLTLMRKKTGAKIKLWIEDSTCTGSSDLASIPG